VRWAEIASASGAIVAISSPPGFAARGIVRISGDDALAIVHARLAHGEIIARRAIQIVRVKAVIAGVRIEVPAIALVMVGPATFTGQDTVELLVVGHPALLNAVVDSLCDQALGAHDDHGARRAEPGEFSARAFLAGKLDMAEAESIALAIAAESDTQLDAAKQLRDGRIGRLGLKSAQGITSVLALVEAGIDFSDQEDVVAITARDLVDRLGEIEREIAAVVERSIPEESLRALPIIALRGATNAGKSSLFNALLGDERAVASPIAGSTRDAIAEPVRLNRGREALLVDLPGIEDPTHALARRMQELAERAFTTASLQLNCIPLPSGAIVSQDLRMITVWTKADQADAHHRANALAQGGLITSAVTGEGIAQLREAMTAAVDDGGWVGGAREAPILLERHRAALAQAQELMASARTMAQACVDAGRRAAEPAELIATDLRGALDALGVVAGHRTPDDVLGELFARFCIGK